MEKLSIQVGARASPLSKAQVQEVYQEILKHHPQVLFEITYLETTGDKDRIRSLRTLGKTDFFTKEVDQLLLKEKCRLAIHSAKDLPEPIPEGLTIAALTTGVDAADVLVFRQGESLETLPSGARIATSSMRREEQVRLLRDDLQFFDLRGTIGERLSLLDKGEADGVVVAEAALIRLGLTHLNRVRLPGETAPYQGQLALLCRENDSEMQDLLRCLDSRRRKILYLGLDLPENQQKHQTFIHYPIIRIQLLSPQNSAIQEGFKQLKDYTHLLFTSKSAVHAFFHLLPHFGYKIHDLNGKESICVGKQTARTLQAYGIANPLVSPVETAEGITDFLESLPLQNPYFFWPHSALSRPVIVHYLEKKAFRFKECIVYDTFVNKALPKVNLDSVDEIYFTSPSTIDAFVELYGCFPKDKILKTIGPVTEQRLRIVTCQN